MRYAIRDVIREDGVVGTLVLNDAMHTSGDTVVMVVEKFTPYQESWHQEPRRVARDPLCNFREDDGARNHRDDLVLGVDDHVRDSIFK